MEANEHLFFDKFTVVDDNCLSSTIKVNRVHCVSDDSTDLLLDVFRAFYDPLKESSFEVTLIANEDSNEITDLDEYAFVMNGSVYDKKKKKHPNDDVRMLGSVKISFSGLFLRLQGDPKRLKKFYPNQKLLMLVKPIS